MKKLLLVLSLLLPLSIMAEQRTIDEAQNVASNYLRTKAAHHLMGVSTQSPQLSLSMTGMSADKKVDYYVFNNGKDNGFIIVSGDDKAAPVLGYCDEGSFDVNDIPDGMRYWLECYAEQMQYLRSHPQSGGVAPRSELTSSVKPLLTTLWNQNEPYYNFCPSYSNGHAVTGCVATATAQIMNYYQWPVQGTGSHSYTCNVNGEGNQTLSANFNTTYDWDNMLDDYSNGYSTAQGNAVATLMYHIGVASEMNYGSSSGTGTYDMMEALRTYFGYNKGMKLHKRGNTPIAQWDSLLMNELDNSHPVIYSGFTPAGGGHAFVLDGYNADGYYHINWGWGGTSNGYFLITALNPRDQGIGSFEGGYNAGQEFISGFYPDDGSPEPDPYVEFTCEEFSAGVNQVNLGSEAPINLKWIQVNGYGYYPATTIYLALYLTDLNGNEVDFNSENQYAYNLYFGANYNLTGDYALGYTPSTSLADGQYQLWLLYQVPEAGMDSYEVYNHSNTTQGYIPATVQNGVMYFGTPETNDGELSLVALNAPSKVGASSSFDFNATISNSGDEYYDNIYFALKYNGNLVVESGGMKIDVATGNDVTVNTSLTAPSTTGNYQLVVLDKNKQQIGDAVGIEVVNSSNYDLNTPTNVQVASYYMDADNVIASATIYNNGSGDYVGTLPFMIIDVNVTRVLGQGKSSVVTIPAHQSVTVNFNTSFSGSVGTVYLFCLRNPSYPNNYYVWGEKVPFEIAQQQPSISLEKLLEEGEPGETYNLGDNLTIVDAHAPSLFVTNGKGSWIEVKCGDNFSQLNAMDAFKAGTVYGTYNVINGNPSLTLTQIPEAGVVQDVEVEMINMNEPFAPAPAQVIEFNGYYFPDNGIPVMRAFDGSNGPMGQSVTLSLEWLTNAPSMIKGHRYTIHGVAQLKHAWDAVPALKDESYAFQNYIVYPTQAPAVITAIGQVDCEGVKINVASGNLNVVGASSVTIYNAAGALVSTSDRTYLPAGVYVVVADGKRFKVIVK